MAARTPTGALTVWLQSRSFRQLPIEVRDAEYQLVSRGTGRLETRLPEGLYQIRALLPGGGEHQELVSLRSGTPVRLTLRLDDDHPRETRRRRSVAPESPVDLVRELFATSPGDEADSPVELVEWYGCDVERGAGVWLFRAAPRITDPPYAVFRLNGSPVRVSLPVNPEARWPTDDGCAVAAVSSGGGDRLVAGFARQRQLAATVETVVRSGRVLFAEDLLDEAVRLLHDKYRDPAAAAFGGLTLHRLGRLAERARWVENLARDFSWVPDGRVLLAAVLARSEDRREQERGLHVLLASVGRRLLFTDGLALQLDLLRRWPGGAGAEARADVLRRVVVDVATVDWTATCLTQYDDRGDR